MHPNAIGSWSQNLGSIRPSRRISAIQARSLPTLCAPPFHHGSWSGSKDLFQMHPTMGDEVFVVGIGEVRLHPDRLEAASEGCRWTSHAACTWALLTRPEDA